MQLANQIRFGLVFQTWVKLYVDLFFPVTVKECGDNVHMVLFQVLCYNNWQEYPNCRERYDNDMFLTVIHPMNLKKLHLDN